MEKILKNAGVNTHRSFLDIDKVKSLKHIFQPPVSPRDNFAVIGDKLYATAGNTEGYTDILSQIDRKNLVINTFPKAISTAQIVRVGKDIWWDIPKGFPMHVVELYKK